MIIHSLRLGARKIVRHPGLSAVTFLTLAIGIAVSATIFAVTWSTLIRPFPFPDQDRLVQLWSQHGEVEKLELSHNEIERIRKESKTIESIGGFSAANFPIVAKRRGEPMELSANLLGAGFFQTFGTKPLLGRMFNAAENRPGGSVAALLSWSAWQERFGGDPNVLREVLSTPDGPLPIVGVMPRHFDIPKGAEILLPLEPAVAGDPDSARNRVLTAVVKLRPGATIDELGRELKLIAAHERNAHPENHDGAALLPYPLVREILGSTRQALQIIFAMGLLVLLIAMLNVASIALAQGVGRAGELGVRSAVGGTKSSNLARFFVESSVLALTAATTGFMIARVLLAVLLRIAPPTTPRIDEVHIGWETALFALGAALMAALITAAAQAFRATERETTTALRAGARSTSHRGARRLLESLAAAQTAVAILTIIVAALLTQSFRKYASIDVGFSTERIVTFHLPRNYMLTPEKEKAREFFKVLLDRLRNTPGVEAVGATLMRPLEVEQGWDFAFTAEGQDARGQEKNPFASYYAVTPGYFDAMRIERIAGRDFSYEDREGGTQVAVIGESFARRHFGGPQQALGKRVKSGKVDSKAPWVTVVGVVRDVRTRGLTIEKLDIYMPFTQDDWSPNYVAVRTSGNPEAILPAARAIVAELDKEIPVAAVRTSRQLVDAKLAQPRLSAAIVILFAVTATLLSVIGFYGMLAYVVRERIPEIGVRLAVGADGPGVLKMILRRAAVIAAVGIVAGAALGLAAERLWRSHLYGISGVDPRLFAILAVSFEIVAVVASLVPAARAARVDTVTALRAD